MDHIIQVHLLIFTKVCSVLYNGVVLIGTVGEGNSSLSLPLLLVLSHPLLLLCCRVIILPFTHLFLFIFFRNFLGDDGAEWMLDGGK